MKASRLSRAFYLQIARNPSDRLNEEKKIRSPGYVVAENKHHQRDLVIIIHVKTLYHR